MNEAFQRALKAQDLEAIRRVPKTDLHNHGVAGADSASVEEILGRRFAPLDHKLKSMAEMHAWAREDLGNINPKLGPRLLEAAFARATWDGLVRYELGEDVWSITVHGSAENVTQRLKKAHARGAPKVEWIPQRAISRHCRIEDIRRWMEPFLSLGIYRTFDLSGTSSRSQSRTSSRFIALQERRRYASRPMWASGVTPTRFGAQ